MNKDRTILLLAACVLTVGGLRAAKPDIASPQAREIIIESGEKLLAPKTYAYDLSKEPVKNPFAPNVQKPKVESKSLRPASDHDFLILLANQLNPTGAVMAGDEAFLLFGEKKVKVGDSIRIPFDNENYDVELVDLGRTSFTVRFNTEQITRPIKPAKAP